MNDDHPIIEWLHDVAPSGTDLGAIALALLLLKERWHNPHSTPTVNLKDWLNGVSE